ncbi:MAG: TaqI-like C-terminal specificity domain-containing protein, partial [Weissella cibaria]
IIRPILRGRDIYKDRIEFANLYVITAYKGINEIIESRYPAVFRHLKTFETQLKQRGQVEGKPGKTGSMQHHWTELDNNISLEKLDDFNIPKILFSEMVKEPQFYLDKDNYFANDTVTFITGENMDNLVKMLNSKTIFTIYKNFYAGGGLGQKGVRVKKTFLESLPLMMNLIINSDNSTDIEEEIQQALNLTNIEKEWINKQNN